MLQLMQELSIDLYTGIEATVPSQLLQRPFTLNGFKHSVLTRLLSRLGINNLSSIPVQHCMDPFAVVVDTAGPFGWVVYSGDGQPSYQSLVRAGMDANVLIHEATFETNLAEEAVLKQHSTVGEAMEVGHLMNAQNVVSMHHRVIPRSRHWANKIVQASQLLLLLLIS